MPYDITDAKDDITTLLNWAAVMEKNLLALQEALLETGALKKEIFVVPNQETQEAATTEEEDTGDDDVDDGEDGEDDDLPQASESDYEDEDDEDEEDMRPQKTKKAFGGRKNARSAPVL